MGSGSLQKGPQRAPSPLLPREDTTGRQPSVNREGGLTRHQICRRLDPGVTASGTVRNKRLLLKLPVVVCTSVQSN